MIGIYKITNQINGKVYIGQSVDIERRWKDHKTRAFNNHNGNSQYNCPLYRAMRKYGLENFNFSVLIECSRDELNQYEYQYIHQFNSIDCQYGYNLIDDEHKTGTQKITQEQLKEIIDLLQNSSMSQVDIAHHFKVAESTISQINSGKQLYQENISYPIRKNQQCQKKYYCKDCGKEISRNAIRCKKCSSIYYINERYETKSYPTREELKKLIRDFPFTKIGKIYNVTDNAVRRWCEHYKLPKTKREINSYSDEEWDLI